MIRPMDNVNHIPRDFRAALQLRDMTQRRAGGGHMDEYGWIDLLRDGLRVECEVGRNKRRDEIIAVIIALTNLQFNGLTHS
jgi:hypothetical protein